MEPANRSPQGSHWVGQPSPPRGVDISGLAGGQLDPRKPLPQSIYRLASAQMDESHEDFKKGRKQLRNAQDFAREQSYQLRDQLQGVLEDTLR
ncbi:hypothetical protein C8A00DRAFT_36417 [Chaetomidium leptoderma]|uniref:Uncharacterized protein n=1 Tax=Chaetomidium leptoderma TaxID=669021 RepID=A0AAN6ZUP3_9PEZI|nr:hypothetical protein C8A00DRAFT_36417 [Chaetomidium leptoderma]